MLAPRVILIRSEMWKFFPNVKSELKNPGRRHWLRRCVGHSPKLLAEAKSLPLKHWLAPFTQLCCGFGATSCAGVLMAPSPFVIAVVPSITVNGRPLRVMKFSENTQPPRIPFAARLLKWYGSVQTQFALNWFRIS